MASLPKNMLRLIVQRDQLTCQWCGIEYPSMEGYPIVPHHRRNRGMGGFVHKLSEILLVCSDHNQDFEDGLRNEPVIRGFRIPRNSIVNAEDVPLIDHSSVTWFLTDRGTKISATELSAS